jgi:uncharacterized protein (DUF2267 family)
MNHKEFVEFVAQAAGDDTGTAERAVHAVLQTLGERLGADEGRQLVSELPPELAPWLHTAGPAERFDAVEFVRRVAEREETDPVTAERHVKAVLTALSRATSDDEYRDLKGRLSKDYAPLLPKGTEVGAVPAEAFLAEVGDRAGVDRPAAQRATEAVLKTLAERIAAGEVDDLLSRLPVALHPPLERGRAQADAATRRMHSDEFLDRVARRAQATSDRASEYTRAVLAALREAVRDPDFFNVTVQLPSDYWALLETPRRS